ncbi:helix-turn-helix domain-containing protein [Asticcacaulis sp. AND118]|uniref:helix-turn-helix domain-containing protein n=1 Tax=Asticcacaulis sp. AND118 TaxID=2840468 RepID=UPI001CFFD1A6|nr:helix-turn-helix domain-containing protein [Asticcacaulis sp. AND118]UDF04058.1 helix-turn-helix domain-containing protein [Asticcacaulis sp. AND118]
MTTLNPVTTPAVDDKAPNPVDIHVGARVRMRRKFLGLTQEQLADQIGITFQQVQKYERGSNRISASKLHSISVVLQVPVAYFFDGFGESSSEEFVESSAERNASEFLISSEGIELAEAFPRIRSATQRRKILDLVRSMGDVG